MGTRFTLAGLFTGVLLSLAPLAHGADIYGLETGTPRIQSAGPLAFGPDGILLVGDTRAAAVFAIATDDKSGNPEAADVNIDNFTEKMGGQLGMKPRDDLKINDLAVNPASGNVYLSVTIVEHKPVLKSQPKLNIDVDSLTTQIEHPAIVRISTEGTISRFSLEDVAFSKATLSDAPKDAVAKRGRRRRNPRNDAITDLAFVDGQVLVSGLSGGESPSSVRSLPFPFTENSSGASLEIYHGAHGRSEDHSAIRVFVPFTIDGEPNLLAGFTCTPLVKFPLAEVAANSRVEGTTVAELGNRNRPLDMIAYQKDGKDFLLINNSARGVMKVSIDNVASQEGIHTRVEGGGTAGLPYETIGELEGIEQLDRSDDAHAIVLVRRDGTLNLKTIALP